MKGVSTTSKVVATGKGLSVCVGPELLGRVLDGLGQPIDGLGPIKSGRFYPIDAPSPDPLNRKTVKEVLPVGIRTIDGLITCGKGQRMGIFAGSGVGKSSLLGMMARNTKADLNVIALVGERGREVREFLENDLGEEGLKRSVVVVATSDKPPLVRLKAAMVATTITEYFRDQGADVLFLLDSLTRVATAGREVGLTVGEPPTTRGYTPSVFAFLPKLLERAGSGSRGTTTAFYTVLVEGDDMDEPVADAVRSILDGHIVLSRSLAERGHYPAIDVLASVSRVMTYVSSKEHQSLAMEMKRILATYKEAEDLINIGAYARGSNPEIDRAITTIDRINKFLIQPVDEKISFEETLGLMEQVLEDRGQNNEEVRV
jgi:flagellum-specific ATP synthase